MQAINDVKREGIEFNEFFFFHHIIKKSHLTIFSRVIFIFYYQKAPISVSRIDVFLPINIQKAQKVIKLMNFKKLVLLYE